MLLCELWPSKVGLTRMASALIAYLTPCLSLPFLCSEWEMRAGVSLGSATSPGSSSLGLTARLTGSKQKMYFAQPRILAGALTAK